jgi:hypothetical protein
MRKILTTLQQKWPEYLIEAIVIIASIIGAFALENYEGSVVRRNEEIEILKDCRTELMADLAEINLNLKDLRKSHRSLNIIITVLEQDGQYHDSLALHFNYGFLPIHFIHSSSAFETLRSRGLDIVSNPDIRAKLIFLYDSQYEFFIQAEAEELDQVQYVMRHILSSRFQSSYNYPDFSFNGAMIPLDFESLKNDQEYLYFIKTQSNRTRSFSGFFYTDLKESVESMIHDLDIEIKNIEI